MIWRNPLWCMYIRKGYIPIKNEAGSKVNFGSVSYLGNGKWNGNLPICETRTGPDLPNATTDLPTKKTNTTKN